MLDINKYNPNIDVRHKLRVLEFVYYIYILDKKKSHNLENKTIQVFLFFFGM